MSRLGLLLASGWLLARSAGLGLTLARGREDLSNTGCSDLKNHGSHFTIEVEVGTPLMGAPAQTFSVVADTGSNTLIIPSCQCQAKGRCSQDDKCFTGTGLSSTFKAVEDERGKLVTMVLSFGSGQIQGVVAQDVATVGNVKAFMKDGLLLMIDRALNIEGAFEGILGLGLPMKEESLADALGQAVIQGAVEVEDGAATGGAATEGAATEGAADAGMVPVVPGAVPLAPAAEPVPPGPVAGAEGATPHYAPPAPPTSGLDPALQDILNHLGEESAWEEVLKYIVADSAVPPGVKEQQSIASAMYPAAVGPHARVAAPEAGRKVGLLQTASKLEQPTAEDLQDIIKQMTQQKARPPPKGFLEQSGDMRFSMCFNRGSDGVLRIGGSPAAQVHGSSGTQHWGMMMEGISLGAENMDDPSLMTACYADKQHPLKEGQISACGAIPDSGTTLFMGPGKQVAKIMESMCDRWDRCKQNHTQLVKAAGIAGEVMTQSYGMNPYEGVTLEKSMVFQMLLADCRMWMTDESSLDELPPLHFHVVGEGGTKQVLKIPAKTYIMEMEADIEAMSTLQIVRSLQNGTIPVDVGEKSATGKTQKVCQPAFGPMEYPTTKNGPVWILGTGLFYEYVVGYDMETTPPSMSFTPQSEQPCGSCASRARKEATQQWRPLEVNRKPRMPTRPYEGEM